MNLEHNTIQYCEFYVALAVQNEKPDKKSEIIQIRCNMLTTTLQRTYIIAKA